MASTIAMTDADAPINQPVEPDNGGNKLYAKRYKSPPPIPPNIYSPQNCLGVKKSKNILPNQYKTSMLNKMCITS